MDRATMLRNSVRGVAPFLYAAGSIMVIMGDIAAVSFVERAIGFYDRYGGSPNFTTLRYNGDVIGAAATLVIGGVVFGLLALVLVRLERLHRPAIRDHLRHCTTLCVILGTLVILLLALSLAYAVVVVAFFTVGYAIIVDALVLWWQRQKCGQASSGNSA